MRRKFRPTLAWTNFQPWMRWAVAWRRRAARPRLFRLRSQDTPTAIADPEMEALAALAEAPHARPPRFRYRSWEVGRHMVERRLVLYAQRKRDREAQRREQMQEQLNIAACIGSSAGRASGARRACMKDMEPVAEGAVLCPLACGRTVRGHRTTEQRQERAALTVMMCAKTMQ